MSRNSNPQPIHQNRSTRTWTLGAWALTLLAGALLPFFNLDVELVALMSLLTLVAGVITSTLVAFTFRRQIGRPLCFASGVALSALAFLLLNALASAGDSLPIQSIASVAGLLAVDFLWMAFLIGGYLVWLGRGGWLLLIAGSVAALWLPGLAVRLAGIDAAVDGLLGQSGQTNFIGVLFCGALCAVPIALLALLSRLLRGLAHEISDATLANR